VTAHSGGTVLAYDGCILQAEFERLQIIHETSLKDSENDLCAKLCSLREELNGKWKDTLRWIVFVFVHLHAAVI